MGQVRQRLHASCSTWVEATRVWLTRASLFGSLLKRSPHVLVVPVVLFCLMTALGIWGVKTAVSRTQEIERNTAAVDADSASQALQLAVQRATLPLVQLAEISKLMPQWSLIEKQWKVSAPAAWLGAPKGSLFLVGNPLGVSRMLHPTVLMKPFTSSLLLGVNSFLPPLRDITLEAARLNAINIQGPALVGNFLLLGISYPVQIKNMAPNDTWDYKFNERLCPPGLCYNNETRTRLWGAISLFLDAAYLFGPDGPLSSLVRKGYRFQLWHPPVPLGVSSAFESLTGDMRAFSGNISASSGKEVVRGLVALSGLITNQTEPADALVVRFPVVNQMWELHVWKDSWAPSWMLPLIAVVVLGALLVSVLVFTTLWSWAENRALLHSLLPKETIERMRQEGLWATDKEDDAIKTVRLETPAELMLRIIEDCIAGRHPDLPLLLSVRDALHRSADVYRPNEQQMRSRMNELENTDDEVRRALAAQLMGSLDEIPEGVGSDQTLWKIGSNLSQDTTDSGGSLFSSQSEAYESMIKCAAQGSNEITCRKQTACDHVVGVLDTVRLRQALTWCETEVHSVLARWLMQTPTVITLVQEAGKQSAPATTEARLIHPADPVTDNQADNAVVAPVAVVVKPILTKLEQVLRTANDWSFDAFELEEASHGRPLSCLGFWLLHSSGVKAWARIKTSRLICFLERVEAGYADNPYHNKRHAADVLQSVHVIMHQSGLMPGFADQLTLLGCYLAAIVHDFEHVGRNNDFLVNSSDDLAIRYNDRSPMENHHLAAAWSLLKTKECNILSGLSSSDVAKLRKLVIDLVLGTDMKQHFAIQGQFETMAHQANDQETQVCNNRVSGFGKRRTSAGNQRTSGTCRNSRCMSGIGNTRAAADGHGLPETGLKPVNDQDQLLSLQMMLKCADLGHIAAPLPVHLKWVSALEAELFLQGDAERAMGLPISPLCDRTKEGVTKLQIGFFNFVVLPGSKAFCNRFTGAGPLLAAILINQSYWESLAVGWAP